jgi:hypothetical protein
MSFAKKNWMPLLLFKGEKDKHNAYRLARWDTNKSSTKFQKKKRLQNPASACLLPPADARLGKSTVGLPYSKQNTKSCCSSEAHEKKRKEPPEGSK